MHSKKFRFGEYEVDFGRQELRRSGIRVGLQHKPFRVLELLLRNPGELVTRQQLFSYLWPDSHVSYEHGLNSAVNSLRQALDEPSRKCNFIETRSGLGYRFVAPVSKADGYRDAHQDCLKGRYLLDKMSEEENHKALAHFNSATADEACAALAHAGIAEAYCQFALAGSMSPSKIACQARLAAESAVQLNPDLPEASVSAGWVSLIFDWDFDKASEAAGKALQLEANHAAAHILRAALLRATGNFQTALDACQNAVSIQPLSFPANLQLGACLHALSDFEAAAIQCWKILSLASGFAPAQLLLAHTYEQMGLYEEAAVEFQNAQLCSACRVPALSGLIGVLKAAGLHSEANNALEEFQSEPYKRYVAPYWQAVAAMSQGDHTGALDFLETARINRDPAYLGLKADPRFHALLAQRELTR